MSPGPNRSRNGKHKPHEAGTAPRESLGERDPVMPRSHARTEHRQPPDPCSVRRGHKREQPGFLGWDGFCPTDETNTPNPDRMTASCDSPQPEEGSR